MHYTLTAALSSSSRSLPSWNAVKASQVVFLTSPRCQIEVNWVPLRRKLVRINRQRWAALADRGFHDIDKLIDELAIRIIYSRVIDWHPFARIILWITEFPLFFIKENLLLVTMSSRLSVLRVLFKRFRNETRQLTYNKVVFEQLIMLHCAKHISLAQNRCYLLDKYQ